MKYRRKPEVVEAVQWDGTPKAIKVIRNLTGSGYDVWENGTALMIDCAHCHLSLWQDDWLIKGADGRLSQCSDSEFQNDFEEVEDRPMSGQAGKGQ